MFQLGSTSEKHPGGGFTSRPPPSLIGPERHVTAAFAVQACHQGLAINRKWIETYFQNQSSMLSSAGYFNYFSRLKYPLNDYIFKSREAHSVYSKCKRFRLYLQVKYCQWSMRTKIKQLKIIVTVTCSINVLIDLTLNEKAQNFVILLYNDYKNSDTDINTRTYCPIYYSAVSWLRRCWLKTSARLSLFKFYCLQLGLANTLMGQPWFHLSCM